MSPAQQMAFEESFSNVKRFPAPMGNRIPRTPKVLALIPARGGSKGLPRKNIIDLCGKPLVAYSIDAALQSTSVHRVIVSTDDEEIAAISRSYGAEVPFLRPGEIAKDHSSVGEAVRYTVERLNESDYLPDAVIILYPTHPFRTAALIDFLVEKVLEGHSPVNTVKRINCTAHRYFQINCRHLLVPLSDVHMNSIDTTQRLYFRNYGLFSGFRIGHGAVRPYLHVITDPVSLVDIDTIQDFYFAEEILARGLFDFQARGKDVLSGHAGNHTDLHR